MIFLFRCIGLRYIFSLFGGFYDYDIVDLGGWFCDFRKDIYGFKLFDFVFKFIFNWNWYTFWVFLRWFGVLVYFDVVIVR